MKITYYLPTTDQDQTELCATVARLFPGTTPEITQQATGTSNIDWEHLDSLADLLDAELTDSPFVTFSLDPAPTSYTPEQLAILEHPDTEVRHDHQPHEIVNDQEEAQNNG